MTTKDRILKHIRGHGTTTGSGLARRLGVSRQAVNKHLKGLVGRGLVRKSGATKGAVYQTATGRSRSEGAREFRRSYAVAGLEEGNVFNEMSQSLGLRRRLSKNVLDIAHYAFTEMVNNAIDHSVSKRCTVKFCLEPYRIRFSVRDWGIGIFYSVASRFRLRSEGEAIGELTKGKVTTMKERHSGEGIFFTSKVADLLSFRSHRHQLAFDAKREDVFFHDRRFFKGTEVEFSLSRNSKRHLEEVFSRFAPIEYDYKFERTRVAVKLFESEYVSRSEARRLLAGLDKFKEIELDFKGVRTMGQGFADEVFRVFQNDHPKIRVAIRNMRPNLQAVLRHVVDKRSSDRLTMR